MFEKISYKNKFFALIFIIVLLSIVSYKRSFKLTYEIKESVENINQKLMQVEKSNSNIRFLSEKISTLDRLIGQEIEPEIVQHLLLDYLSQYKNVQIIEIKEMHHSKSNSFTIYSNQLLLEGGYNELIQIIYSLEKDFNASRIISVQLYKEKDYKNKQQKLYAKLIFQNYEKKT